MAWTRNAITGILTHSGTVRELWRRARTLATRFQIAAGLAAPEHNVKVSVRASGSGHTRLAAGVEGSNLVIQQWEFGALLATLASVAHVITPGQPYTTRVVVNGDSITVYAGTTTANEVSATVSTPLYRSNPYHGVESNVDGAVVNWISDAEVSDRILTVTERGVASIGGDVYDSSSDGQWTLVQAGVFEATGRVAMVPLAGKMLMVGMGRSRLYDPIVRTLVPWVPTAGTLMGQTDPGTTTATILAPILGGVVMMGDPNSPLAMKATAINDPFNLDTAERLYGSAWEQGVGRNATVGDPIVGAARGPDNTLCVACTNSVNFLVGDRYRGTGQIVTRSESVGCSGPTSFAMGSDLSSGTEILVMSAPEGLQRVFPGGGPVNISSATLKKYVSFDKSERASRTVVLARDPSFGWMYYFNDSGSADSTHLIYVERVGGYSSGQRGGFYPIKLPVRPTCAALIRGKLIIGTREGRLVRFESGVTSDLGQPIASKLSLALVHDADANTDVVIREHHAILGAASGSASMALYGGVTAEAAFKSTSRRSLLTARTVRAEQRPQHVNCRAPAIVMELNASSATQRLIFEMAQIRYETRRRSTAAAWTDPAEAGEPCGYPSPANTPSAPTPPTGPGPGTRPTGSVPPTPPTTSPTGPIFRQSPLGDIDIYIRMSPTPPTPFGDDLLGVLGDTFSISDVLTSMGGPGTTVVEGPDRTPVIRPDEVTPVNPTTPNATQKYGVFIAEN